MVARLASLRSRLLLAMVATALIGLAAAQFAIVSVEQNGHAAKDRREAASLARAVAHAAERGAGPQQLASFAELFPGDDIVVARGGRVAYSSRSSAAGEVEVTRTARFRGGLVTVRDRAHPEGVPWALLGVVAGVIAFVILGALVAATLLTRSVREPIERAVAAADRVASGDFGARMGTEMVDELARLGRAFDEMAQRLESADLDQRRFLADVAHEIATPVNAVSGFALALADGSIENEAERAEAAALIEAEVRRLRLLLDDLRRLTRLDLAEGFEPELVDLRSVCAGVTARFAPAAREAGIELGLATAAETVLADPHLLETVLDNLVSNAIRYTPRGGRVVVGSRRSRDGVVVSVADTGIGIAAEHRTRVFDRLYRIDAARDRDSGGTGLGLAIAQRAALAMGGRIELESELGHGSEFRLVLPRRHRRAVATAGGGKAARAAGEPT